MAYSLDVDPRARGASPFPSWDAEARILHLVRRAERLTRNELVEATGLSRAAIDQAVTDLLRRRLLVRAALGPSVGGRRPSLLAFNRAAGYVFGVDIGATSIDVALADLGAAVVDRRGEAFDIREGPDAVIAGVKRLMGDLLRTHAVEHRRVLGIGVGLPGPIEYGSGRPVAPPIMPGWDGVRVPELFRPEFTCPVYVDNDVNVMALGEQWAGVGREVENFILVKVGTGIGAGIISDGRLHRGADGCAGDIGHIEVDPQGPLCHCGNRGCLEAVAAGPAIARRAMAAAREGQSRFLAERLAARGTLEPADVAEAAQHGDQAALELVRTSGQLIGRVLAGLVNFFNPSLIVVSGGVAGLGDLFLAGVREVVYSRSTPLSTRRLMVQRSQLPATGGVIGASLLPIDELFAARLVDEAVA